MEINRFSISDLTNLLRKRLKRILCFTLLAGLAGYLLGWCIPKEYRSEASIIPESNEGESFGGASALADMAGISLRSGVDAIGPELYPNVVASKKFLVDMLYTPVQTLDGKVQCDLKTYLCEHSDQPWWSKARLAVIQGIKGVMGAKKSKGSSDKRIDPERMSEEEEALIDGLQHAIECQMNDVSGVIYVSFRCQDPLVTKTVVDTVTHRLQEFITDYRTSKARVDLKHYQEMEQETKATWENTLQAYAEYTDSHKGNNLLQAYESQRDALENEMQLALTAYNKIKQQVQLAEAKVQEKTPAFTVLEVAGVPARHFSPRKSLMAISWMFIAFVGITGWYYVRLLLGKEQ